MELDTLVRVARERGCGTATPGRLAVPAGMEQPLGCDAVAVPKAYGPELMARLPRVGCVYVDGTHWWWIVPADSDVALEWPPGVHYAAGAVLPDPRTAPVLLHQPDESVPYTPPLPLYVALCRAMGTTPGWSQPVRA
ncbi:hypothetical protein ACQB60_01130 [Actinomycetota bacterium Odt1-20B]